MLDIELCLTGEFYCFNTQVVAYMTCLLLSGSMLSIDILILQNNKESEAHES